MLNNFKSYKKSTPRKSNVFKTKYSEIKPTEIRKSSSRKRYYEKSCEDLNEKNEKSFECTKNNYSERISDCSEIKDSKLEKNETTVNGAEGSEENLEDMTSKPRRSPIGPLPAYIPIG